RAVATARGRPPGPVHLNLAFREPLVPDPDPDAGAAWELDGRPGGRPWTALAPPDPAPTERAVADLTARVAAAERGLLVVGDTPADPAPLLALAEAAGWPVVAEPLSGARSGPHAISTAHHLLASAAFTAEHRPDLVLRVGRIGLSRPLLAFLDAGIPQVLVDPDGVWLDPTRVLTEVVVADPAGLGGAVAARLGPPRAPSWLASWRDAEQRARATLDRLLDAHAECSEPRTARDLAAVLPDGATLVAASSMPVRDLDQFMAPRGHLRVVGNRGASGIDGFVSTALGVALATPGPTAALAGDLSVLHDQTGFLLAERPDLVLVVVHNDGGGIFSFLPPAEHPAAFETVFGTPHGVDFARVAAVYGLAHTRVDHAGDLAPAVRRHLGEGGVALVEVRTDRTANVALHRRLTGAVGEELAR
ncbi:MAG: thiamine pyrophosphate-dependent enzyme, partial [Egibacteraceae bacterium]